MPDSRFFKSAGPTPLKSLVLLTGAKLHDQADALRHVSNVAPLNEAGANDISFFDNRKYRDDFKATSAGACFIRAEDVADAPIGVALLIHSNPYLAYALAAEAMYPFPPRRTRISESAIIDETAKISSGCDIGPNVVIGPRAEIGARSMIGPNVVIGRGVIIGHDCRIGSAASISHSIIGNRVVIYPGARIGQDGFGYAWGPSGHVKVPQLGRVLIEDDVEIGANTTIDRGSGPDTTIGRGTIIDNLVQIAHNVTIGPNCILVSQSGIAGSSTIGAGSILAAQSGVAGHLTIGSKSKVMAQSGVMRDIPDETDVCGSPAIPTRQFFRQVATLQKLSEKKGKKTDE